MDQLIQATVQALQATLHYDQNIRQNGEQKLEEFKIVEGYAQVLLRIIASNEVDGSIRQGASVFLKNMAVQRWRGSVNDDDFKMCDADAQFLKDNLLDCLVHTSGLVKNQIQHMIEVIANRDFPEQWPLLLEKSIEYISSANDVLVLNGIIALQVSIKRFQYVPTGDKRGPLIPICARVIPLLLAVLDTLANAPAGNADAAVMQRKITKVFYYAINFDIPPVIVEPAIFQRWMSHFYRIVQTPTAPSTLETTRNPQWLLKNTVARIMHTLLMKTGKIRKADSETKVAMAKLFVPTYAMNTLKVYLDILTERAKTPDAPFHERYLQHLIEYFGSSLAYGALFPTIKTFVMPFVTDILFPLVCFSKTDEEQWNEDPHEYLRNQYDSFKDFYSPRAESHSFILSLVGKRGRVYLDHIVGFCIQILQRYNETPAAQRNPKEKYGALAVIGHFAGFLKSIEFYRNNLEQMMVFHVFPELQSPLGYLRGQACWVFSQFHNIPMSNPANFSNALRLTLGLMSDKDLPVRIRAGTSICNLVQSPQGTEELRPVLGQLLERIFALMNEMESEELVTSIDSIIRRFKYEIGPYAISLVTRLSETFLRLINADDDNSGQAAQECLSTIMTLSRAIAQAEEPELYVQLEPIIVPLLQAILVPEQLAYFEEGCGILTFFTYYPRRISPALWTLFPMIVNVFNDSAADMIDAMVNPIDNFITYGTEHFITGGPYIQALVDMYKHAVGDYRMPTFEASEMCKIMESVLQHCRGRVDPIIPIVLETACARLLNNSKDNEMSKELTVYLLEQVANCLYYNAAITVDFMTRHQLIEPVFTKWFVSLRYFQRYYDKKIGLLGLTSLFTITPTPAFVLGGSSLLIKNTMQTVKELLGIEKDIDAQEKQKKEDQEGGIIIEDEDEEDEDEDEDVDFDFMGGEGGEFEFLDFADDEDVDDPEERNLDNLEKMTVFLDEGGEFEGDGQFDDIEAEVEGEDGEDGEDDEDDDLFENESGGGAFETPIDDVDELEYMINSFQILFQANPTIEQQLDPAQRTKIQKYIQLVPIRKAKEAAIKKADDEADAKKSAEIAARKKQFQQ